MNGTKTYDEFWTRYDYIINENPQGDARQHELSRLTELVSRMTGPSKERYKGFIDELPKE